MDNKIYYVVDNFDSCYTPCGVRDCKIGSVKCQECGNLISINKIDNYVKCKVVNDAKVKGI